MEGKNILVKFFELKKYDEDRIIKEVFINLFFLFKEELFKRVIESNVTEGGKLLNDCEYVLLSEMLIDKDKIKFDNDGRGESIFFENDFDSCESDLKEENLVISDKRKCLEDSLSVNSDLIKLVGL